MIPYSFGKIESVREKLCIRDAVTQCMSFNATDFLKQCGGPRSDL